MCDSVFDNVDDLESVLAREEREIVEFLTTPAAGDAVYNDPNATDVPAPSFPALLDNFPRFTSAAGAKVGSIPMLDAMGDFVYSDFALRALMAGTARTQVPLVFREEVGVCREAVPIGYGLPLASNLMVEGLAVYNGTNLVASNFRIQTVGYMALPAGAMTGDIVDRLATTVRTSTLINTYADSSIRAPLAADLLDPDTFNRPIISGLVDTDAALARTGYSMPLTSQGFPQNALVTRSANQNEFLFTATNTVDLITAQNPPDDLDFVRVTPDYTTGTLNVFRSSSVPASDPANASTFIDGARESGSQTAFVSQNFTFNQELSHQYGSIIANFTGATDRVTHTINFGSIGVNILPSSSPWEANPGNRPLGSRIYRQHDLILHRGRRYYAERDITPETNPVPGTTTREDGVAVADNPFTGHVCGIPADTGGSPFTAANQIIYSTGQDVAFLNPPADDTGIYNFQLTETDAGITPSWVGASSTTAPPLEQSLLPNLFELPITRVLTDIITANFLRVGVGILENGPGIGTQLGNFLNAGSFGAAFENGFFQSNVASYGRLFVISRMAGGLLGVTRGASTAGFSYLLALGADGRVYVLTLTNLSLIQTSSAFLSGYFPSRSVTTSTITRLNETNNSGFTRVFDIDRNDRHGNVFAFLEKGDGSCWMYGNVGYLNTGSGNISQSVRLTDTRLRNIVKIEQVEQNRASGTPSGTTPPNAPTVVMMDNQGRLFAAGTDPTFATSNTTVSVPVLNGFRQILSTSSLVFTNFSLAAAEYFNTRTPYRVLVLLDDSENAHTIHSDPLTPAEGGTHYTGSTDESVIFQPGVINRIQIDNVIDINISSRFWLTVLTRDTVYVGGGPIPGPAFSTFINAQTGEFNTEPRILSPVAACKNPGWARIASPNTIVDVNGRIAIMPARGGLAYI